jgi:Chaperone of endosialidase
MNPLIQFKMAIVSLVTALVLACFGLLPKMQAVSPTPDGGYPGANTAEGEDALFSLTTGTVNTAIGFQALYSNTEGGQNTATGAAALYNNTTGTNNTAHGAGALFSNTTGSYNVATGDVALTSNTTGDNNTANGSGALFSNTTGHENTAAGIDVLRANTTGSRNTATGGAALATNTTGNDNTATGNLACPTNTTGGGNTADGSSALRNSTGNDNTAIGNVALGNNTTGDSNTALGSGAGGNLTTGNNNIDIGNAGVAGEGRTIRIGTQGTQTRTFVAGIFGTGVSGSAVKVNSSGQLGVAPSSARFKDNVKHMDKASEAILALKPVTFQYKKEFDPEGIPQFGLVAEEVEKINPALITRDADGKPYTVRYEAVNAMLLNEFLKAHRKIEQQELTIAQLKKDLQATAARQQNQIEALTAGLQKVSAQLEASKPAPQVVLNNQ